MPVTAPSRRGFLACCLAAAASPAQTVADFLGRLASALSDNNASQFLSHFDPSMADYRQFQGLVSALLAQAEVGSSIEIAQDSGDDTRRALSLDWILELSLKSESAASERRQATVKCTLERRGKNWKVTALDPIEFFRPMDQTRPGL